MALPTEVQKQVDEADKMTQVTQPQGADTQVSQGDGSNPAQEESQGGLDETEKLKSRYASLQGKYNAEVPRLHEQNRALDEQIKALIKQNEDLRNEIASREANRSYLTQEDEETYGKDMVDFVKRATQAESARFAQLAAQLKSEVQQLRQDVTQTSASAREMQDREFFKALTRELPDWEAQNQDEGFLKWLDGADPVFGVTRNEALQRAVMMRDAERAASIFVQYRRERQGVSNPLAKQVAPSKSHRGVEPNGSSQHIWTESEIQAFYDAWRRKQIPEDKAKAIAEEIDDAIANNRVRV